MGKKSVNEVRVDVKKTGDEGSGAKPSTSSFDSFGNEREKKRTKWSPVPCLDEGIRNRMDKTGEGGEGLEESMRFPKS